MQTGDCFRTLTLLGILKTRNWLQGYSCASLAVKRLCQQVGCARSKLQSHTVRRNLKCFLDAGWRKDGVLPLSICGILLLKHCILPTKYRDTWSVRDEICSVPSSHSNTQSITQIQQCPLCFLKRVAFLKITTHRVALDWSFDTGRNRRRNNYGKVKTDVLLCFEDCRKHFNGGKFECIKLVIEYLKHFVKVSQLVRGDLQLKIQIKMTQQLVLKCCKQM